jgi:hypothetical protein
MPCLVIDASDQHWELVSELSRLVDCQTIAETVKHCAQDLIGAVPVYTKHLGDFLEPCVCLMKRFVEHFEARRAHVRTFLNSSSDMHASQVLVAAYAHRSVHFGCRLWARTSDVALIAVNLCLPSSACSRLP